MWLVLLRKAWPYIAFGVAALLVAYGIYDRGRRAERAEWEPKVREAEVARAKAETELKIKVNISNQLTTLSENQYAQIAAQIDRRALDSARDIRAVSLRLAKLLAERSSLSTLPGATGHADDEAAIEERAYRAADRINGVGYRCELDAAQLEALQNWVTVQKAVGSPLP
jgi:hypothetical protein